MVSLRFFFLLGQEGFAAEAGKDRQFLLLALVFDQHPVSTNEEQLDSSQLVALFQEAGLAVGRAQKYVFVPDPEQGHGQRSHERSQDFAFDDAIDTRSDLRRDSYGSRSRRSEEHTSELQSLAYLV